MVDWSIQSGEKMKLGKLSSFFHLYLIIYCLMCTYLKLVYHIRIFSLYSVHNLLSAFIRLTFLYLVIRHIMVNADRVSYNIDIDINRRPISLNP